MEKKLTRIGIIDYCNKCHHVKNECSQTLCGLTGRMASFDYECDKFVKRGTKIRKEKKSFWGSWKVALLLSVLGFLRFGIKMATGKIDIFGMLFLIFGICWLLFALFGNED